ncbi:MAG: hypothetical protein RL091_2377, partial [Verrucomicrobiota bacterium]
MKSLKTPATLLFTASLTLLTFTACSKTERETVADKTKVAYQDTKEVVKDVAKSTKDAVVQGWDNLKSFTFEKRDAFTAE